MCNLYDVGPSQDGRQETIWEQLAFRGLQLWDANHKRFGIRKTDPGLVLVSDSEFQTMRWGFDRSFNTSVNNARTDKLLNGMWQSAWEDKRRCIIPVSAYYEWTGATGKKQTHVFQSEVGADHWLWAAGIWEEHAELGFCYSMITTENSEKTGAIHDRMPAILDDNHLNQFLTDDNPIDLLKPSEQLTIQFCENPLKNPHHDGPVITPMLPGFE